MPDPLIAGAIIGSGVLNAGASIFGGLMGSSSSEDALNLYKKIWKKTRQDLAPWRETGGDALDLLWNKIQAGAPSMTDDPGYQWRLSEGQKAIDRAAAARGTLGSGSYDKALLNYNQNAASQEYSNTYSRWLSGLQPFQNLASMGLSAAGMAANANNAYAQGAANQMNLSGSYLGNMGLNVADSITGGLRDYLAYTDKGDTSYISPLTLNNPNPTGGAGVVPTYEGSGYFGLD